MHLGAIALPCQVLAIGGLLFSKNKHTFISDLSMVPINCAVAWLTYPSTTQAGCIRAAHVPDDIGACICKRIVSVKFLQYSEILSVLTTHIRVLLL